MDHARHYAALIDRARVRELEGYSERHHVVPKCLGGDNSSSNIVRLTPEEHYVAHQLLVFMHPGNRKLLWAASNMTGKTAKLRRSNKLYGWLRRRLAADSRARFLGRKATPEARAKMSASHMGVKLGPHSDEHKAKIAAAHRGRKRGPQSPERRASASIRMTKGMLAVWKERQAGLREMPHKDVKGVYFEKAIRRWRARINVDRRSISLGCFKTFEEGREAYLAAVQKYRVQL